MKINRLEPKNELFGVEVVSPTGFINRMWFDEGEPDLNDPEWLEYLHEETKFREELWIQSGRFKPEVVVADQAEQVEEGTPST